MVSVTLSVSKETRTLMKKFSEINWSAFIRKCIDNKIQELSWKEQMLEQLQQEKEFSEWALQSQRTVRKQRLQELQKKGLI